MKPIDKALRNKRILEWFKSLPLIGPADVPSRSAIVVYYADQLRCPTCEITYEMMDEDSLDFLYSNYAKLIDKA
jgi:hypothetical protein